MRLLEATVNVNSGTLNPTGVRAVYDILAPEFEALGFAVRYEALPAGMGRGGHLIAERVGPCSRPPVRATSPWVSKGGRAGWTATTGSWPDGVPPVGGWR